MRLQILSLVIGITFATIQTPVVANDCGGGTPGPGVRVFTPPPQTDPAPVAPRTAEPGVTVPTDVTGTNKTVPSASGGEGQKLDPDEKVPTTTDKKAADPKSESNYKVSSGKTVVSDKTKDGVRTIVIRGAHAHEVRTVTIDKNGDATDITVRELSGKKPLVTEHKYHVTFGADGSRTEVEVDGSWETLRVYDSNGKLIDTNVKVKGNMHLEKEEVDPGSAVRG
jgi:hypothetical protein